MGDRKILLFRVPIHCLIQRFHRLSTEKGCFRRGEAVGTILAYSIAKENACTMCVAALN